MLQLPGQLAAGFTLLEVMVSLVILAIGVLGIIALQMSTYQSLQTSHNFAHAAMLAGDMADRILSNPGQEDIYAHTTAPQEFKDCADPEIACDAADLARFDVSEWQTMVSGLVGTTRQPGSLPAGAAVVELLAGTTVAFNIVVRWDDDLSGSTGTNCADLTGVTQEPRDLDCYVLRLQP